MRHSVMVAVLASVEVLPADSQVALLDRTWQDYPEWEDADQPVAYRAPSLIHPDDPPYPGFAVRTRPDYAEGHLQKVKVELWQDEAPPDLHLLHTSVLSVGRAGLWVGNGQGRDLVVDLPRSTMPLEIYVDSPTASQVSRVVFLVRSSP